MVGENWETMPLPSCAHTATERARAPQHEAVAMPDGVRATGWPPPPISHGLASPVVAHLTGVVGTTRAQHAAAGEKSMVGSVERRAN
jgi:hypothetical protein|eukprot:4999728-Prymnesium_polylepis.1